MCVSFFAIQKITTDNIFFSRYKKDMETKKKQQNLRCLLVKYLQFTISFESDFCSNDHSGLRARWCILWNRMAFLCMRNSSWNA